MSESLLRTLHDTRLYSVHRDTIVRRIVLSITLILSLVLSPLVAGAITDDHWASMGTLTGANHGISTLAADASGDLYVGGAFSIIQDLPVRGLAKWNGEVWMPMDAGLQDHARVNSIAIGNGTAGRETEKLVKGIHFNRKVNVYSVDESGASIYSASSPTQPMDPLISSRWKRLHEP